jgi:adenine-specific DNA-methyltransferase
VPEIVFKGKEYVYNHHLTVPFRPLEVHAKKGIGAPDLAGNLVIHGDNLHALKSLLPRYAGAVDLVFIDPPYNTGNEGWCYSDGVNSPIMKEWLSTNPVDAEDMLRHDKWLCMMWPRLVLLRELLSERGSIWITLDDNEVHRARMVLDEVFGADSHEVSIAWEKRYTRSNNASRFSSSKDWLLVYRKSDAFAPGKEGRSAESEETYTNPDDDPNGPWISVSYVNPALKEDRPNLVYPIENPFTKERVEHETNAWKFSESTHAKHKAEKRLWWGLTGELKYPRLKVYLKAGVVPVDLWSHQFAGTTDQAFRELEEIMGRGAFETIKPTKLLERVLEIGATADSLILDSFAGSGTTAHAVLKANAKDGGTRRFILVEGEDYADRLTAERVRRAIKGYAWVGTQRETLLEEKITFTQFKKADEWLRKVEAIKAREGFAEGDLAEQGTAKRKRFDKINVKLDEGVLRVEGEKKISQRVEGLGGGFTYCTLGEPLDLDKLLSGESLPTFDALGEWLFHTATGGTLPARPKKVPEWYLGEAKDAHVWLIYRPDLNFLTSPDAALTLTRAKELQAWGRDYDAKRGEHKRHLVFAPAKYLSNRQLADHGIDYAPLPFALYREA